MKIFVSHHHSDAEQLSNIKKLFSELEIEMFLAHEDIQPGEHDLNAIQTYIKESCDIFLLIGSKEALESQYVQQEIGLALGAEREIISTMITQNIDADLMGFIKHQQAIRSNSIEELYEPIFKEISRGKYKRYWSKKLRRVVQNGCLLFQTSEQPSQGMVLIPDYWDDSDYRTSFELYKGTDRIGSAKIGFKGQPKRVHTATEIPRKFHLLSSDFFSVIKLQENDGALYENEKQGIFEALNDITRFLEIAGQHWDEHVLQKSLLRDDPQLYIKLLVGKRI